MLHQPPLPSPHLSRQALLFRLRLQPTQLPPAYSWNQVTCLKGRFHHGNAYFSGPRASHTQQCPSHQILQPLEVKPWADVISQMKLLPTGCSGEHREIEKKKKYYCPSWKIAVQFTRRLSLPPPQGWASLSTQAGSAVELQQGKGRGGCKASSST